jgi:gliding motility-associated-like protein
VSKYLVIVFVLTSFTGFSQGLPNIGFENGTFNNWDCQSGSVAHDGTISLLETGPINGLHTIIPPRDADIIDYYGGFPILCPNGSKGSIRLGNSVAGCKANRVSYTFRVPASGELSIIFDYALVLQNQGDRLNQRARFLARMYNVSDSSYIDCPSLTQMLGTGLPDFKPFLKPPLANIGSIFYKDWSKTAVDLHGYPNTTMRLEFTVTDCADTVCADFGYAYIDVEDGAASSAISGNAYCTGQNSVTLTGPSGFQYYYWFTAGFGQALGQGQTLTISPPPPDQSSYVLEVLPYEGNGCGDFLTTVVNKINAGFKMVIPDTLVACPGTPVDLTAPSVTAGSTPGTTFSYYSDAGANNYLVNATKIISSGTYYIKGVSPEGCTNTLPLIVAFKTPTIINSLIEPAAVHFPATVDLTKTYIPQQGLTYTFYKNSNETGEITNYTAIKYSGTYYIKATSIYTGCAIDAAINVIVIPPPPYQITAPTAFTPNGDGINDHFNFTIKGVVTFGSLKIFNRYGQLLVTQKSASDYWDGTYKGKNIPAGVYYWVFDGEDDYNNVKINRTGSITLIR